MAGRVTDALKADEPVQSADEAVQALRPSRFVLALPSVHILTQQGDFAYAAVDERLGPVQDRCPGAADFRPARIGNDAISAEFDEAFLGLRASRFVLARPSLHILTHQGEFAYSAVD